MFKKYLRNIREQKPLIHSITNYVTANDVANLLLASGASPVMSDYVEEVEDIVSISDGLNLNMGTLNADKVKSILLAGMRANDMSLPVVLDAVGAGSSRYRTQTAFDFLNEIYLNAVKGNISEIKALALGSLGTKGVDADESDISEDEYIENAVAIARELSAALSSTVIITGKNDIVSSRDKTFIVKNGREEMRSITGTGCQLSALVSASISAYTKAYGFKLGDRDEILNAAAAAVIIFNIAGEIAWENMAPTDGNTAYRNRIIDAVYNMTEDDLNRASYEII